MPRRILAPEIQMRITTALTAGYSTRAVAQAEGVAHSTVQRYNHRRRAAVVLVPLSPLLLPLDHLAAYLLDRVLARHREAMEIPDPQAPPLDLTTRGTIRTTRRGPKPRPRNGPGAIQVDPARHTCAACGLPLTPKFRPLKHRKGTMEGPVAFAKRQYCNVLCQKKHATGKPRGWKRSQPPAPVNF